MEKLDQEKRSSDTGQQIPKFESVQLTTMWICNSRLQAPTLARKFDI